MRAVFLNGPSLQDLQKVELADPAPPGRGQVLVRMRAASLNFIDLAVAYGQYPGVGYPLIPIADGAGEIVAVGDDVTGLKIGDRVAVHPKALWTAGRGTMENTSAMRGATLPGALREFAVLDAASIICLAGHLSFEQGAALPIAATTAWNALTCAAAGPGSTVVLLGTGGVSIFALQLAKARGARVIITSSSDAKLEQARALGADETINYATSPDWDEKVIQLTGGRGADLVLETVGSATFPRSIAATRHGGVVFTIGFITGTSTQIDLMPIIVNMLHLQGNNTGSVEDLAKTMAAIDAAHIEPVLADIFPLDELAAAFEKLSSGPVGKIAINIDW